MQDHRSHHRIPLGVIAGFSALILATGSAVAWWTIGSASRNTPTPAKVDPAQQKSQPSQNGQVLPPAVSSNSTTQTSPSKSEPIPTEKSLQVYWLKGSSGKIELAPSPAQISSSGNQSAALESALSQLLAGPKNSTVSTTIPPLTKVRSVSVQSDGVHVDLSKNFTQGGGSASMMGRLGQVLYTATSLDPKAPVWLSVEGKPLKTLGGEGLMIDQPITRESFKQNFPL